MVVADGGEEATGCGLVAYMEVLNSEMSPTSASTTVYCHTSIQGMSLCLLLFEGSKSVRWSGSQPYRGFPIQPAAYGCGYVLGARCETYGLSLKSVMSGT